MSTAFFEALQNYPVNTATDTMPTGVAFDIEMGVQARAENLLYDVDANVLNDALLHGGMSEEDIASYPIIIRRTDNAMHGGSFVHESEFNDGKPAIELYTYKGRGPIRAKVAAHEAEHLSSYVHVGEEAFVADNVRVGRKTVAVLGSLLWSAFLLASIKNDYQAPNAIATAAYLVLETDMALNSLLGLEYLSRKHERRARRAERGLDTNNLLVVSRDGDTLKPQNNYAAIGLSVFKYLLVPNFKR